MSLKTILVIGLGGTIAMTRIASGGIAPSLSVNDLLRAIPGLERIARLDAVSPFHLPGASLTLDHLNEVVALINARAVSGIDGAVIVQGTDTIEETAFTLDCLLAPGLPVVVTGAMRGPEAPSADGPANLSAAVTVAASPEACDLGVLVVLNDEVHAARYVRKAHTSLLSSFTSAPHGPVGNVIEGRFRLAMRPIRLMQTPLVPVSSPPPVAVVQLGLGDDGRLLGALPDLGYRGVVIAGVGAGHVPQACVAPLESLAGSLVTVLSTRVLEGPVLSETYGFPGSERDLLSRGLIGGDACGPVKARLLLQLALAAGFTRGDIARLFSGTGDSRREMTPPTDLAS